MHCDLPSRLMIRCPILIITHNALPGGGGGATLEADLEITGARSPTMQCVNLPLLFPDCFNFYADCCY